MVEEERILMMLSKFDHMHADGSVKKGYFVNGVMQGKGRGVHANGSMKETY